MVDHSTLHNVLRMIRSRRVNIYTTVSKEVADEMGLSDNPLTRGHNDERDAFRHAYTSALVAFRHGSELAEFGGDLNEKKNHLPWGEVIPEEEWMDYHNNQKGREIAEMVKVRGGNEEDLKQAVVEAMADNELVLTPFDPRRTLERHGDFDRAVEEARQAYDESWKRELEVIAQNKDMASAQKQEARLRLDRKYREYRRQMDRAVEKVRTRNGSNSSVEQGRGGGNVQVQKYSRSTGSVRSHIRTRPDDNIFNNLSYRGK